MQPITQTQLRALLDYDPETGVFRWRRSVGRHGRITEGSVAGHIGTQGYRLIGLGGAGKTARAARLAWLHVHGEWPAFTIDHINQDKADDRIANLRPATVSQNKANSPLYRNNTSGFKGVFWARDRQRWLAVIVVRDRKIKLGRFKSAEAAAAAYDRAAALYHGDFASPNWRAA